MGLSIGMLRLLVNMHRRRQFVGPVLTLGVQDVYATYDQLKEFMAEEGLPIHEVPPEKRLLHKSVHLAGRVKQHDLVHCETFLRMMGLLPYESLDGSSAEHPTIIHDLNTPVAEEMYGKYGLIIDSGTLEHIFDIRTAMNNLVRMLRLGGSLLHVSPMSGWVNHGFIQISPCLFYDYYQANGFTVQESYVMDMSRGPYKPSLMQPYVHTTSRIRLKGAAPNAEVGFVFLATKEHVVEPPRVPTQAKYTPRFKSLRMNVPRPASVV